MRDSAREVGVPMLPDAAEQLRKPVLNMGGGPEVVHWGKTVTEHRQWGVCVWEMAEDRSIAGTVLLGDRRAVEAARRDMSAASWFMPYVLVGLMGLSWAVAAALFIAHARAVWWVPFVVGSVVVFVVGMASERGAQRATRCLITPELWRLLTVEADTLQAATPDAGLLALVRTAITHPVHHTETAADAIEACAALVAAVRDTPMQFTTTATLASLAEQARRDDPDMWPEVLATAQTQLDKVNAWRAAQDEQTAALEAPIRAVRQAELRDAVHDAFAALDEQTTAETEISSTTTPEVRQRP